jgi:hypothetical protein
MRETMTMTAQAGRARLKAEIARLLGHEDGVDRLIDGMPMVALAGWLRLRDCQLVPMPRNPDEAMLDAGAAVRVCTRDEEGTGLPAIGEGGSRRVYDAMMKARIDQIITGQR